jgi:hypothetical protein
VQSIPEYRKLVQTLESSLEYDFNTVWETLSKTKLLTAQVAVASQRQDYETAMNILLNQVGDSERALRLCASVLSKTSSDEAYHALLGALFADCSPKLRSSRREFAALVLERNAQDIDCRKALRKVPATLPVSKLHSFLRSSLSSQAGQNSSSAALRGLLSFSRLSTNCEMIQIHRALQDRVVEVDKKGIGES